MRDKNATCSCGTRPDEWDEDREAYVPETVFCPGHSKLAMQQNTFPRDKEGNVIPGHLAFLMPRDQWEAKHADDN